jgi:signal transduction histidine kinase
MSLDIKSLDESKVLIVDDTAENIEVLYKTLEKEGFQIAVVFNGKEALANVPTFKPDLILLDIMMPVMDGFETCKSLKSNESTKDIPVIFLTAKVEKEDVMKGFKLGAVDYITKPFQHEEVLARINTHLKLRQTIKANKLAQEELNKAKVEVEQLNKTLEQRINEKTLELKEANEKINRSEKLAAMGGLAGIVGHEIRGPLSTIKNSAFFLKLRLGKSIDQKVKEHLQILEEEVNSSVEITNNILSFARVKEPILNPIDANSRIKTALRKLSVPNNVEVVLELSQNLPAINADVGQMDQIFSNIILNALQAMTNGGTITIATRIDNEFVVIECKDTGEGIKEKDMEKVFEPLFTTKSKGTGLGLPVSYSLIEKHGGKLQVESEEGEGTIFKISLPIKS